MFLLFLPSVSPVVWCSQLWYCREASDGWKQTRVFYELVDFREANHQTLCRLFIESENLVECRQLMAWIRESPALLDGVATRYVAVAADATVQPGATPPARQGSGKVE